MPDGSTLYLSNESTQALDIVDTKTLKVRKSIPLSGRPNNVAIHNSAFAAADGRRFGGPAPPGLYRFRVTDGMETSVVIGEVEEDVLLFF